jgi:DNA modification methylase
MKMNIDEIVFRKDLYPRLKVDYEKVKEYEEILTALPPIIINQDKILIDGAHRYYAFKNKEQKEIEVNVLETKDDDDIALKAIELNAKHGFQLTQKEKKDAVVSFYKKILEKTAKTYDTKRLKETFSIPDSTFSDWTKDMEDKLEGKRLELILDLYLQCKTQKEMEDDIGIDRSTISTKLKEIRKNIDLLLGNPTSELPTKYSFLAEKMKEMLEFKPLIYNLWNIPRLNNEVKTGFFGVMPIEFMENLLYYYTNPFDLVYDPFAGSGVTIDACEKWLRQYYVSDLHPAEMRKNEIKEWNIQDGVPKELGSPKLVLLDPPYWKQAEGQYSEDKNDLGNMPLDKFYETLGKFCKGLYKKMNEGSYLAYIIQGTQWKNEGHNLEDHAFELYHIVKSIGFQFEQRIICPYPDQYNAQQVEAFKSEKKMLTVYRDLVVFKK